MSIANIQDAECMVFDSCTGAFRLGLCRLMQLKGECNDLKRYIKELQLAEHGLDARSATDYSSLCSLLSYLASSLRTDIYLVNARGSKS